MLNNLQHNFKATELDPKFLPTPFKVQTYWHVITGAQSSGKTTLIGLLADKGFQTVPEAARQYFDTEMARGRTLDEILKNGITLQRGIRDMQLRIEHRLRAIDFVFLDRSPPDSLTFYRVVGLDPNETLAECFHHRYASIFVLDRLPIQQDGLRIEDDALAVILDEWLACDYSSLGYQIVRVPVLPPQERLAFILERLSEQGLI